MFWFQINEINNQVVKKTHDETETQTWDLSIDTTHAHTHSTHTAILVHIGAHLENILNQWYGETYKYRWLTHVVVIFLNLLIYIFLDYLPRFDIAVTKHTYARTLARTLIHTRMDNRSRILHLDTWSDIIYIAFRVCHSCFSFFSARSPLNR